MILKGGDSGTEKKAISGNLIKVIQDVSRARSLYLNLLEQATGEIMLMIPTPVGWTDLIRWVVSKYLRINQRTLALKLNLTPLWDPSYRESDVLRVCKYWQEAQTKSIR
jgi:hypothetical protein